MPEYVCGWAVAAYVPTTEPVPITSKDSAGSGFAAPGKDEHRLAPLDTQPPGSNLGGDQGREQQSRYGTVLHDWADFRSEFREMQGKISRILREDFPDSRRGHRSQPGSFAFIARHAAAMPGVRGPWPWYRMRSIGAHDHRLEGHGIAKTNPCYWAALFRWGKAAGLQS